MHWTPNLAGCRAGIARVAGSTGDVATAAATFRLQACETVICAFTDQCLPVYETYVPLVMRQS